MESQESECQVLDKSTTKRSQKDQNFDKQVQVDNEDQALQQLLEQIQ